MVTLTKIVIQYVIGGGYWYQLSIGTEVSTEVNSTNTTKETRTATVVRKEASDNLGSVRIYFYDPIIEAKLSSSEYRMRTYNTGHVTFGISTY